MDIRSAIFYAKERETEILLTSNANISQKKADRLNREAGFLVAASNAMEYRLPKRPKALNQRAGKWQCPGCGVVFAGNFIAYCSGCGQAIDWSVLFE